MGSDEFHWQFPKNIRYFCSFHDKAEKHRRLCLNMRVRNFCTVFWRFLHGITVYTVDSDEAR